MEKNIKLKNKINKRDMYDYIDSIRNASDLMIKLGNKYGEADDKFHTLGVELINVGAKLEETANEIRACVDIMLEAQEEISNLAIPNLNSYI